MRPRSLAVAALAAAALLAAGLAASPSVQAQDWPPRPVRIITGFAAGGPSDLLARVLGPKLQEAWGQPVIVEARPGAAGNLAMEAVAKAPPDGLLLVIAPTSNLVVNPHLFAKLGYDPVRDFAPVAQVAVVQNMLLVHPSVPARTVQEVLALARAKPGTVTFASPANGSQAHLAGELLNQIATVNMVHVPYKGTAPAVNDLLGGQVTMMFVQLPSALPSVRAGKLRAIGIASRERSPLAPDVPTLIEQNIADFEAVSWYGMMAPAGTPREIVARIQRDTDRVLRQPDVVERMVAVGADPAPSSSEALATRIKVELERWGKVVKQAGIRAD